MLAVFVKFVVCQSPSACFTPHKDSERYYGVFSSFTRELKGAQLYESVFSSFTVFIRSLGYRAPAIFFCTVNKPSHWLPYRCNFHHQCKQTASFVTVPPQFFPFTVFIRSLQARPSIYGFTA